MTKTPLVFLAVATCLWCQPALADRLTLRDGRVLVGTVTEDPTQVTIQTSVGTASFRTSEVADIQHMPTPEQALNERLARIRPTDPQALYELAQWADQQGLRKQSANLHRQVLLLSHDHPGARKALGYIRVDAQWMEFAPALEIARAKIAASPTDAAMDALLEALAGQADTVGEVAEVRELSATLLLRRGKFAQAKDAFAALAKTASGESALRLAAIVQVLNEHPDGLYVLTEPYPPDAAILGKAKNSVPTGPASLAQPLVLQAALRDKAKVSIEAGRKLLQQGRGAEPTEPESARRTYLLAVREFDNADAVVAGIARGDKIEVARRQIAMLRKDADDQAAKFDAELAALGKQALPPQAYASRVARMMNNLTTVRGDLDMILKLAKPYPLELVLDIRWAELDNQKITSMLATLKQELNATR